MDPRDVNKINYNNYCVGKNLDFLIRSKMRSESLSTPLTNTPVFYEDDQVSAKMKLLGKRTYYDPEYIYGQERNKQIPEPRQNPNLNQSPNRNIPNDYNEPQRQLDYQQRINQPPERQEQYQIEQQNNYELPNQYYRNNEQQRDYNNDRDRMNYHEYTMKNNDYPKENINSMSQYDEYNKNDKYGGVEDNKYGMRGYDGGLTLPKTREQIQHDVYLENFKRQQLLKQMQQEENNSRQNYYK